VGPMSQICGM